MNQQSYSSNMFETWAQFVIPLFAFKGKTLVCIGSTVIITHAKIHAISLTAVHVIDYADSLAEKYLSVDESKVAPFLQKVNPLETFAPLPADNDFPLEITIAAVIDEYKSFAFLKTVSQYPGKSLDIAALALQLPSHVPQKFPMRCAISSRGPKVGDKVYLCGYPAGNAGSMINDKSFTLNLKVQGVVGHVTEIFGWDEHFLVRSPGFYVDVHAPSGFSGGGVFLENDELGPVLCGIISASDESRTTAMMIWPALGLKNNIPHTAEVPNDLLGLTAMNNAIYDLDEAYKHMQFGEISSEMTLKDYVQWI